MRTTVALAAAQAAGNAMQAALQHVPGALVKFNVSYRETAVNMLRGAITSPFACVVGQPFAGT